MADNNDITDLYNALIAKEYSKVGRLCHAHPEYLLRKISTYNDTALHMIAHSKQKGLVLDLLKILPAGCNSQLSNIKNDSGNTILHEVATRDAMKDVAEELLNRNADLLTTCNDLGEKPIFYAARYGQTQMFEFLAEKMELEKLSPENSKPHLQRNDGTTVLHISITTECFHLSSSIVERYPYLIKEMDQSSMTAFQYLACNPTAFQKGKIQIRRGFIEYLNESKAHIERSTSIQGFMKVLQDIYGELFKRDMRKKETWLKVLVKHLIQNDGSWNNSISSDQVLVGLGERKEHNVEAKKEEQYPQESLKSIECPLLLATMSNIKEIVEEILKFQPHAVKNTNKDGMNILHVAVLYRHTDIFDMVVTKFEVLARMLLLAKDNKGNSVLHMVSLKRKSQSSEKMQSPALQLRNELLLFEKVKAASKMLVSKPLNNDNKTAEELFAAANEQLHVEAKEWLMRTTENCTILSVFIATVAFAAAYTVPGGPDQNSGYPMLHSKPFFMVFVSADMISITLALTSVGIFLSILTSSFPLEDFERYLFTKLVRGIICLILSVSAMSVAFGATIVLTMARNRETVVWDAVAFLPVPIFFLSYSPLRSVLLGPCKKLLESFAACFLVAVILNPLFYIAIGILFLLPVLLLLIMYLTLIALLFVPYGVFRGLRCAVEFIRKIVRSCNSLILSHPQPLSDATLSPQPTTATPLTQV